MHPPFKKETINSLFAGYKILAEIARRCVFILKSIKTAYCAKASKGGTARRRFLLSSRKK
jgi:hypothetical protein